MISKCGGARHNPKAVISQLVQVRRLAEHGFCVPSNAQQDCLVGQGLIIGDDGQLGSRHLFGESLQFLGGVDLGGGRVGRSDDCELACPVGGEGQAGLFGKGRRTGQREQCEEYVK